MAERAREQLNAMPAAQRTANDYRTVIDVYRLVYHTDPADVHAPESIFNVALLLADQGTTQHDPKLLNAAIGQFEFLRTQYPHSSLRSPALLEEAQDRGGSPARPEAGPREVRRVCRRVSPLGPHR